MPNSESKFIISLDCELYWGVRDHRTLESYQERLLGDRKAVPQILDLFQEFGVHATWATVGFLFFDKYDELMASVPRALPSYEKTKLDPYRHLDSIGPDEEKDPFHYGRSLIKKIQEYEHQEVATHTFSHYYCLEPGQTIDQFLEDIEAAKKAAAKLGLKTSSIVFPRNQFNDGYVAACKEKGIIAYRGNPRSWIYAPLSGQEDTLVHRGLRLVDAYLNVTGHHGHKLAKQLPVDVAASRFLRPYSPRYRALEPLRLKRITTSMSHCAKKGLSYHLWWHPHNFGQNTEENLAFLRRILEHYSQLREQQGMRSLNMLECANEVTTGSVH